MRIAAILCVCAIIAAGCNTRSAELEKQNAELQAKSNELYKELTNRDEYIGQVMESINGMHENLEGAREREQLIMNQTDKLEGTKKPSSVEIRQNMLGQLTEIDSTLKSDKKKLADLQAKSAQGSLVGVESQHGLEAVRVVLTREAEVTKTWDALLEARGDKK